MESAICYRAKSQELTGLCRRRLLRDCTSCSVYRGHVGEEGGRGEGAELWEGAGEEMGHRSGEERGDEVGRSVPGEDREGRSGEEIGQRSW